MEISGSVTIRYNISIYYICDQCHIFKGNDPVYQLEAPNQKGGSFFILICLHQKGGSYLMLYFYINRRIDLPYTLNTLMQYFQNCMKKVSTTNSATDRSKTFCIKIFENLQKHQIIG